MKIPVHDIPPYQGAFCGNSCVVLSGPSYRTHYHVSPIYLMKPRFPIPDPIRREMETWLGRAQKEAE